MQVINAFLLSSVAGLSTLFGIFPIFFKFKKENIDKFITYCLAFSIAIMIGVSITDLIPTSFFYILFKFKTIYALFIITTTLFIGGLLVIIINKLSIKNKNSLYKLGILNMVALMLHNFPEGVATFMSSINDIDLGVKLSIAIMLHNIPEGISIAVPIYYSTMSRKKAIINTFISGLAEPFGAFLTYLFLYKYINETMINIVLLLVAGIMITLSIHEMLPEALKYKNNKFIYFGLISGIILIIVNLFLL